MHIYALQCIVCLRHPEKTSFEEISRFTEDKFLSARGKTRMSRMRPGTKGSGERDARGISLAATVASHTRLHWGFSRNQFTLFYYTSPSSYSSTPKCQAACARLDGFALPHPPTQVMTGPTTRFELLTAGPPPHLARRTTGAPGGTWTRPPTQTHPERRTSSHPLPPEEEPSE